MPFAAHSILMVMRSSVTKSADTNDMNDILVPRSVAGDMWITNRELISDNHGGSRSGAEF